MLASRANSPTQLEVQRSSATCAIGVFRGVLLVNWRKKIAREDVRAVVLFRNQLLKRGLVGAIHMAEPGLPLPDDESRKLARSSMESRGAHKAPIALAIFGEGFGASAIRSVGTAVFALRSGPPTRIFANTNEATTWLSEQTVDDVDATELLQACEELRATEPR